MKYSPYNKKSGKSKEIMLFFKVFPDARVSEVAKLFGRSIPNVHYLKGETNVKR